MVAYAEHDADDAEDDGEEARVVDGQVLRRQLRRRIRFRRRLLPRIVAPRGRPSPRRPLLHLGSLPLETLSSGDPKQKIEEGL